MYLLKQNNILIALLIIANTLLFSAEDPSAIDPWKIDLQILLGFSDDKVDGIMGKTTFEALQSFAVKHQLTDVVLRGEYDDLGFWGFQQYIIKFVFLELKNVDLEWFTCSRGHVEAEMAILSYFAHKLSPKIIF